MGKLSNFFNLFKRNSLSENNNINDKSILNEHENVEFNLKDNDYNLNQIDINENINAPKELKISNYALNNTFSNESDFLKLFKYDSIADSSKTFNIETALNNNWDKVDNFAKDVSQEMEQKADKESPQFTGTPTINGNEIATVNNIPAGLSLGETSSTAYPGDRGKVAYDHSQSAHAPSTAQKNSDITKAEIEAKLTGEVSTHTHASDSTKAPNNHAVANSAYGLGTTELYGHCALVNGLTQSSHINGLALSAYQGKVLNDRITSEINNINTLNRNYRLINTITLPSIISTNAFPIEIMPALGNIKYSKIRIIMEGTFTFDARNSTNTSNGGSIKVQNTNGVSLIDFAANNATASGRIVTNEVKCSEEYELMHLLFSNDNNIVTKRDRYMSANNVTTKYDINLEPLNFVVYLNTNCSLAITNGTIKVYVED